MSRYFPVLYSPLLNKQRQRLPLKCVSMFPCVCLKMLWEYNLLLYKPPHLSWASLDCEGLCH